ncbi:hypothetical protein FRC10_008219 [Ceratobasidium sp. 414]|nr:hypothetical protein FRC10_008219 [Ceratobasidium sp. 414]
MSVNAKGKQRMVELPPIYAKAIAAATGSTTTALTMTPFDLIKTRLQTQPTATATPPTLFPRPPLQAKLTPSSGLASACCRPSPLPCVRNVSSLAAAYPSHATFAGQGDSVVCLWDVVKVSRAEGVAGLWKGVGTSLTIAVPASTAYMLTYDHLNHSLPVMDAVPLATPLAAGIASRTFVASLISPLELVRTRIQSTPTEPGTPHTMKSVLLGIRSMVATDGVRSLWRGLAPTLWRDVPFSGIYWAGYESGKRLLKKHGHTGVDAAFASGAGSGIIAALITMPFDTLKTRRQAALVPSGGRATNSTAPLRMVGLVKHIVQAEGPKALFAGLTPRVAKIAPACGIMIACYEGVGKFLSPIDPESDEIA